MGSGKSTVGRILADTLGVPFVDLDERIESIAGATVNELFVDGGEDRFRALETQALAAMASEPPSVIACGGGVVVRDENRALLPGLGRVVYLTVSAGEAVARIGDTSTRPLLTGSGAALAATSLLAARESLYTAVADVVVQTESRTPEAVARVVSEKLEAL